MFRLKTVSSFVEQMDFYDCEESLIPFYFIRKAARVHQIVWYEERVVER